MCPQASPCHRSRTCSSCLPTHSFTLSYLIEHHGNAGIDPPDDVFVGLGEVIPTGVKAHGELLVVIGHLVEVEVGHLAGRLVPGRLVDVDTSDRGPTTEVADDHEKCPARRS